MIKEEGNQTTNLLGFLVRTSYAFQQSFVCRVACCALYVTDLRPAEHTHRVTACPAFEAVSNSAVTVSSSNTCVHLSSAYMSRNLTKMLPTVTPTSSINL